MNLILEVGIINILFTFFIPSGGVETLNRQRYYALQPRGINCHFLYLQKGTGLQNKIDAPIYVTNNDKEIKDIIEKGNFDAIVVNSDLLLQKKMKESGYTGLVIYEVQGLGTDKKYADYFLQKHASPILNQYCDAILYPRTPHLVTAFEKHFPHLPKYSFHNSFSLDTFHYKRQPKQPNPIVGWVGRLEENKNWRDFLKIGAQLKKEFPSLQLWMFEDSTLSTKDERIAFKQNVQELQLHHCLQVFENQPHHKMAAYFSTIGDSGGFLCSTSKVEGFGYAVLEAMVCKCPVLSTDSDGVKNFIKHNRTGKFFTLGNIAEAVSQGKELMTNNRLREKIRNTGVKHIENHFSPENYATHFINMIEELKVKRQSQ